MAKRLLLFLDPERPSNRIIRRGIVIGVLAFLSVVFTAMIDIKPAYAAVFIAILAALDKFTRELKEVNK